jgi:hypothetical protein
MEQVWQPMHLSRWKSMDMWALTFTASPPYHSGAFSSLRTKTQVSRFTPTGPQ